MKTSRIVLSAALASLLALSATPLAGQETEFGVRSGVVFGGVGAGGGLGSKPGITVGPTIALPLNRWFAVQAELLYSSYGVQAATQAIPTFNPTFQSATFRSLQIPLLARLDVGRLIGGPVRAHLYAGPHASYLLSCRLDGLRSPCGSSDASSPFGQLKSLDVGTAVGMEVGVELFHFLQLTADMRYQRGFRSMGPVDRPFQNRAWSIAFSLSGTGYGAPRQAFIDTPVTPGFADPQLPSWGRLPKGIRK